MTGNIHLVGGSDSPLSRADEAAETQSSTLVAMKAAHRWLLHRSKVPYYVNGMPRSGPLDSPEDVAQLATYEQACEAVKRLSGFALGFALGPDGAGCWQGVDLDNIEANGLGREANALPGYLEVSPGSQGAHAIGYGKRFVNLGSDGSGVEAYSSGRFFTFTGKAVSDGPLCDLFEYTNTALVPRRNSLPTQQSASHEENAADLHQNTIDQLRSALRYIDPNPYELWTRMGHALKKVGEVGLEIWLEWSSTSPKFNRDEACNKWRSFDPKNTGYRAVFAQAQRAGWKNPGYTQDVPLVPFPSFASKATGASGAQLPQRFDAQMHHPTQKPSGAAPLIVPPRDGGGAWLPPREIRTELPPAPPFDEKALLPEALATFVMDEADRMPCAPDYVASALMVCIGSVIGARCGLKPKRRDDWLVTPNLYGGVVGEPSAKKSPALANVIRFLDRLQAKEAETLAEERKVFAAEQAAFEAHQGAVRLNMKKAADKGDKDTMLAARSNFQELAPPDEPRSRRYKSNDSTVEKLGDLLVHNPRGLLVFRDELIGLLASWEKEGREGDKAFYLEGWNGTASFNIDRIGRGSLHIPNLCLSVFGGIQPDLLEQYLANITASMDNDGRIQRFQMLVYPDRVAWQWRDRHPVKGGREAVRDLFDRLAVFDPVQNGAAPADDFVKLPHFHFDDEAQEVFVKWSTELHTVHIANEGNPLMAQHLGKYEKLFCSIALILHLAEGSIGPVTARNALRAAAWCEYLAGHARRVYGLVEAAKVSTARLVARRLAAGKLQDGFTVRDMVRKQWAGITTSIQAEAALLVLEENGWVKGAETDNSTGRQTIRYYINPHVLLETA